MADYFLAFGESRRPWLNPERLKEKFHTLSASVHPDRVHDASPAERGAANERYVALNAAYQCLRNPRERLAHLLELERGSPPQPVQSVPPELMEVFFEMGRLLKEAETFLGERASVTSPLLKVQLFSRAQEIIGRLESGRRALEERQAMLLDELRKVDVEWVREPLPAEMRQRLLGRMEGIQNRLSYYSRWSSQLQERIVRLTLP